MQLRQFVCGSAVLLSVWLVVTFFHKVPSQRYNQREGGATTSTNKGISTASPLWNESNEASISQGGTPSAAAKDSELVQVSASQ